MKPKSHRGKQEKRTGTQRETAPHLRGQTHASPDKRWESVLPGLADRDDFLFLETCMTSAGERRNLLFADPEEEIIVRGPGDTAATFRRIEEGVRAGLYAAGLFSYELGYCLEPGLFAPPEPHPLPLLSVGLYRDPAVFDARTGEHLSGALPKGLRPNAAPPAFSLGEATLDETYAAYERDIRKIKRRIEAGDTYQINHTLRLHFRHHGDPLGLYLYLRERQGVPYAGMWRHGEQSVLSFSPELFFRIRGGVIEARPMKGTVRRGDSRREDRELIQFLGSDIKNRAENVMIVDLLRNDLGRVARDNSVHVPRLFQVEPYSTLFQMTSTVRARLDPRKSVGDIFTGLFPCGSVTGAPKISSMRIIRELEGRPRGIYTGALGFIEPRLRAVFNVTIRTLWINGPNGELGLGGGIVYDSDSESEWDEALLKGKFLLDHLDAVAPRDFSLIETLLWRPRDGYFLLDPHIERLANSAAHFAIPLDEKAARRKLAAAAKKFSPEGASRRVRLLLSTDGKIAITSAEIVPPAKKAVLRCVLSTKAVLSANPYLRHKTTVRSFYDAELQAAARRGYFDIIFQNERGEITEGARTNIVVRIGKKMFTPPVACGLLGGVYRRHLLETGEVKERVLFPRDLARADQVFLCNSVRGIFPVKYEPEPPSNHARKTAKSTSHRFTH